ncbi:MAG TPA: tetratricopeptide repeat protein [Pyrinomonadaceae bacterium]|nr:tetratricopeptide repeat protein [Pyrinomonadaceae bacterium]
MANWLRLVLMLFYAPMRGMRELRDRGALAQGAGLALLLEFAYSLSTQLIAGNRAVLLSGPGSAARLLFQSATIILLLAGVLVPILIFVGNLFERRGSFSLLLQQEYATLASTLLYAFAWANLLSILAAVLLHVSGLESSYVAASIQSAPQVRNWTSLPPEFIAQLELTMRDPQLVAAGLFRSVKILFFLAIAVIAIRDALRVSTLRSVVILLISLLIALLISPLWGLLLSPILASPFLLLMLFLFLRGYVGSILQTHRARESFRQNLEAATLNPADASAHYNLGLIHQQRGELDAARERFERAVKIDEEEIDAHYQLGRIARQQKRLTDAIKNFEPVVSRNPAHAQYEVWREVGSTYLEANQFEDARAALEEFLEHRPSDPEGLYLMGRAHAGLGHQREAASLMEKCIEAVKTSPAYKYRASKRWLNEAQQFLRSQV